MAGETPLNSALDALRDAVSRAAETDDKRMPPLRELSRIAGVSQATMQKAVAILKAEGVITTAAGRGMRPLELTPAQRRAFDHLRWCVAQARRQALDRLPTVAQLAVDADVSLATMAKALAHARDAGLVRTTAGSGVYVAESAAEKPAVRERSSVARDAPVSKPGYKWEGVAVAIGSDLLNGVYRAGQPLPSVKELCSRYGVCGKTLNKALQDLADRGRIFRERTRYVVATPEGRRRRNTIVLVARGTPSGELFRLTARTITNLRLLEIECSRHGLRLVIATHSDRRTILLGPRYRGLSFADGLRRESVLGFVVWTTAMIAEPFRINALFSELASHRRPIAVLDDGEWWRPGNHGWGHIKVFFSGGGSGPGSAVGRFLLGLGHRKVAWFAPKEWAKWARNRVVGLREEYARAGLADSVIVFESTAPSTRSTQTVFSRQATNWYASRYVASLPDAKTGGDSAHEPPTEQALRRLRWQLSDLSRDQMLRKQLVPLLNQAAGRSDITAWVGANDVVALQCLDYLQLAGRRVPDDISVVGFDNSTDSTIRGLTTYDPNAMAFMHAMLSHILDPRLDPWDPRHDPPIEIEGYVTERATTAPCRRQ
ncbi:MAG: GntR family transcriptional regulator [Chitinivibrionales bacterium]|nr:GntR family transcriptional regulator [Chitinivibrionales bacterium]